MVIVQSRTMIITALISSGATLIVGLIVAFLGFPPFQDWVRSLTKPNDQPEVLSLEAIPQQIFPYGGEGGGAAFWLVYDDKQVPTYRLDYSLPAGKNGYAGLVFQFVEGQDLSPYHAIEFTLIFSLPNDEVDFYLKDIGQIEGKVHIVASTTSEMVLRYEFVNFNTVNFNAVKEIGLISATGFATGNHQVRIKNIRFVR